MSPALQRNAHVALQEAVEALGHLLDGEVEALLPLLVKKAGASSGRDSFLGLQADKILIVLMTTVSPLRFMNALLLMSSQKGPKVRSKVASLIATSLCSQNGPRLAGEHIERSCVHCHEWSVNVYTGHLASTLI